MGSVSEVRKTVSECFSTLSSSRDKWDELKEAAKAQFNSYVNNTLRLGFKDDSNWGVLLDFPHVRKRMEAEVFSRAQAALARVNDLMVQMQGTFTQMQVALRSLTALHERLCRGVTEEVEYQAKARLGTTDLMGCIVLAKELVDMYAQEQTLKLTLVRALPSETRGEVLQMYLTAWAMEPYIRSDRADSILAIVQTELAMLK